MQIWDTAGQERFRNVAKNYFQSSHGFVLIYDITDKESFQKLDFWLEQIKNNSPKNIKLVLVGNKCDLFNERRVSFEEAETFAKNNNMKFFEASAKDGTNVNELFYYLANEIYHDNNSVESNENNKVTLTKKKTKKPIKRFV